MSGIFYPPHFVLYSHCHAKTKIQFEYQITVQCLKTWLNSKIRRNEWRRRRSKKPLEKSVESHFLSISLGTGLFGNQTDADLARAEESRQENEKKISFLLDFFSIRFFCISNAGPERVAGALRADRTPSSCADSTHQLVNDGGRRRPIPAEGRLEQVSAFLRALSTWRAEPGQPGNSVSLNPYPPPSFLSFFFLCACVC